MSSGEVIGIRSRLLPRRVGAAAPRGSWAWVLLAWARGGIGIDRKRINLGFGRRRFLVWRWAGGSLAKAGARLSRLWHSDEIEGRAKLHLSCHGGLHARAQDDRLGPGLMVVQSASLTTAVRVNNGRLSAVSGCVRAVFW